MRTGPFGIGYVAGWALMSMAWGLTLKWCCGVVPLAIAVRAAVSSALGPGYVGGMLFSAMVVWVLVMVVRVVVVGRLVVVVVRSVLELKIEERGWCKRTPELFLKCESEL